MSRKRWAVAGGIAVGALAILALGAWLALRSDWLAEQVRRRIVREVEQATGGRAAIRGFRFDWTRLRAEVTGFTLHGLEPADRPPLFHADSIAVGLKVISLFERKVNIASLDVRAPRAYLMTFPGGRTNIPAPKRPSSSGTSAVETILNLAIGRFDLSDGAVSLEGRGSVPLDAQGRNLSAHIQYARGPARYSGEIKIEPLRIALARYEPAEIAVALALTMERNSLRVDKAQLAVWHSRVSLAGALEDFVSPRVSVTYKADVAQADVARFLRTKLLESGTAHVEGVGQWNSEGLRLTGGLRAENLEYRDSSVRLRGFTARGEYVANAGGVDIKSLKLAGLYFRPIQQVPVQAEIADVAIRGPDLTLRGISVAGLGGSFRGGGWVKGLDSFDFQGAVAGFEARRVVALYSPAALPWDGAAAGNLHLSGAIKRNKNIHVEVGLEVGPVAGGAPVRGQLTAVYDARAALLDLGHSTLTLPHSRVEFSGALGRQLTVRLETRDLNELLPAFGAAAAAAPVELRNGYALFTGEVNGDINAPILRGQVMARNIAYSGTLLDSVSADVAALASNLHLRNGALARGAAKAEFDASLELRDWKTAEDCAIFGHVRLKSAPAAELAALAGWADSPVRGSLSANGEFRGTLKKPMAEADLELLSGALFDEPLDRFVGHARYAGGSAELTGAQFAAGGKQVQLNASYAAVGGGFSRGRLRFQASTNTFSLQEVALLRGENGGARGSVQASAGGVVDFAPAPKGGRPFQVLELNGSLTGRGLIFNGQPLGDLRLTLNTEAGMLHALAQSDFASSSIHGDGAWKLEGDYPGSANVTFTGLDFARLRAWLSSESRGAESAFAGSAQGELRLSGPALRPAAWKGRLTIPAFEFRPSGAAAQPGVQNFTVRNAGPIVAEIADSVVTLQSARFSGRYTDISLAGKLTLKEPNPLDLRVNGRLDVGMLAALDPEITASGETLVNASVKGDFRNPQIIGRMEVKDAAVTVADFPNGLSNASGLIIFSGDRATIQNLSGECGGGKLELSGSVGFAGEQAVMQLRLTAREVRVRYPEGVSSVSNASLNLTGSTTRSMLTGSVTVLRTGFNAQSDFSSVLASSAEPARTPSTRTGMLGGLNYDIQIQTAPDIRVESEYTQDIGLEARLKLRGTVSNPALLGRVNITQGHVIFFGTRYTVRDGSIAFSNPVKVEPIVNVDLETKARGIDVTLTVSGPLKKLNLSPRSDPPLQFNEIVALLATGQAPTSDPTLLNQHSTSPQSWQQMGASALLGQAIASPVTGRLQRFFGVSRLRIDPTLPGVEYNPQARITLEQQVTQDITFTYITVVNNSNPQVVSIEWDFGRHWSARAVREESGQFGVDFFFKRQFK